MILDPSRFDALTFDCYGTLIDWEAGILAALRPVLLNHGWSANDDETLELYSSVEARLESGSYLPYATVLRRAVDEIARTVGFTPSAGEREALAGSLGDWPAFADAPPALRDLGRDYRLAVVSNVDDDLFERSTAKLGVRWSAVVTAEQTRSYKPAPAHFTEVLARLDLPVDRVLHVAQSLYHDIAPASALGLATVWVNRRSGRSGFGATPPSDVKPDVEVPDLRMLVERLLGGV